MIFYCYTKIEFDMEGSFVQALCRDDSNGIKTTALPRDFVL